jgi:thioredoxin reductase (NADPH)
VKIEKSYDIVIIGGGPAGLAAAKHLAFYRRKVLVVDRKTGPLWYNLNPIHNYPGITRPIAGQALIKQLQGEVTTLGAEIFLANAIGINGTFPDFQITIQSLSNLHKTEIIQAKTILLATGVSILHPKVNHQWENWLAVTQKAGTCFYCIDCEAPLMQGKKVQLLSVGTVNQAIRTAQALQRFASEVEIFICTDGLKPFDTEDRLLLEKAGFTWRAGTIQSVSIIAPGIRQVITTHQNEKLAANCFFVSSIRRPRAELAHAVGIKLAEHDAILTDDQGKTNVAGIWAAGDVRPVARQIAVAVGTGNYAALMINKTLNEIAR